MGWPDNPRLQLTGCARDMMWLLVWSLLSAGGRQLSLLRYPAMFTWDETDVLTCLETEPTVGEDALSHHYEVRRDGLHLQLTIFQYDGDAHVVIAHVDEPQPLIDFWMRDGSEIRYVRDNDIEELIFMSDDSADRAPNLPYGFVLKVRPSIGIEFGDSLVPGGITSRCS